MKKILLLFLLLNSLFFSCSKGTTSSSIPACIQQRILELKAKPVQNPPAEITEYRYNGKSVYLISADCCDQYNLLIDENCNNICSPGGGFDGRGDRKCEDFAKKATLVKVVWKDERTR